MSFKEGPKGIQHPKLARAVSKIRQRAEKTRDDEDLLKSYVDVGLLDQLDNENSQIVFGRRGTGKTHLFRVLANRIEGGNVIIYIDCRTLGSASHFSDSEIPLPKRAIAIFKDILSIIHDELMERIMSLVEQGVELDVERAYKCTDQLLESFTKKQLDVSPTELAINESGEHSFGDNTKLSMSTKNGIGVDFAGTSMETFAASSASKYEIKSSDKIVYPDIYSSFSQGLDALDSNCYLLIDEWASIPSDLQPIVAEFIKRAILPAPLSVVKIAALEQRSVFSDEYNGDFIGFELGADISANQDLDEVYVYDKDVDGIVLRYSHIIFNHLNLSFDDDSILKDLGVRSAEDVPTRLFTNKNVFVELSRSAEGVVRDLINIFSLSFYDAQKRGRVSIDKKAVTHAAQRWFEQDKSSALSDGMQVVLRQIIDHVIGKKKARSFMVPKNLEKSDMILRLFDARVIHHVLSGYADKDQPGVRYNIYTLDYGTYIDLIGTSKEPQLEFMLNGGEVDEDLIVPFDDKRSIRRIILKEEHLLPMS